MKYINKFNTTSELNEAIGGELSNLEHYLAYDTETDKVYLKQQPIYHVLTYKTTTENQTIRLFYSQYNMDEVVNDCIDVESGEKITTNQHTYKNIGEHKIKVKWKENLTRFSQTFYNCVTLVNIPSNLFSTNTAVTDLYATFQYCSGLTSIPEGLFSANTAVTNFSNTFNGCRGITSIPSDLFSTNTAVTRFDSTFKNCSSLTSIPQDLFSTNTAVTNFSNTFYGCSGLTIIPEGLFSTNTAVTKFYETFQYCSGITSIPEGLFSTNTKVTDFSMTFQGCSGIESSVPIDSEGTPIYNRSGEGKLSYSIVTSYTKCFGNCTKMSDYDSIPSNWK